MMKIVDLQSTVLPELGGRAPEEVFAAFCDEEGAMLLLSGGAKDADRSYVCIDPAAWLTLEGDATRIRRGGSSTHVSDPLEFLDGFVENNRSAGPVQGFTAGAVGYVSYDYRTHIENVPCGNPGVDSLPDVYFAFPANILSFDHGSRAWSLT